MKKLHFDYCMEIKYSDDISRCCYTIKCIPKDSERQRVTNLKIDMIPETRPEWATDAHGNKYIFGCNEMPHSYFRFHISGDAECEKESFECKTTESEEMIYRHSHGLTMPGEKITDYYKAMLQDNPEYAGCTPYCKALFLLEKINKHFSYVKGCTDVTTGAEEAFAQGKGVCQDYAHIMIALLNLSGCSARYVTGLITGEGQSHAWVEVASEGKWYGFDPTNNTEVGENYIKIGVGRDASECQINRGIMHGGADQTQTIKVSVKEISFGQKYIWKGALLL